LQITNAAPGVEIVPLQGNAAFENRPRHNRDRFDREEGMRRLAQVFAEQPERILQELVDVARELCGADSAGLSVEESSEHPPVFRWVATSGKYVPFHNARLPYEFAPCSVCLERGEPQHFRVGQAFFDLLGVPADLVTDGMLIPWKIEDMRGTIWVVAHGESEAFDKHDCETIQVLADFAAIAVRHQRQQEKLMSQAIAGATAAMANDLAHQINNPLQSLTNILFLAATGNNGPDGKLVGESAAPDLQRLSSLVKKLLALPKVFDAEVGGGQGSGDIEQR
jgi:transcriptional regulator with GAF, ATPase, and Fis domain